MPEMLTISIELNSLAPSQLVNFNFNSFCEMNGSFYGANELGIFKLEDGDRDVNSSVTTTAVVGRVDIGPTDLGIKTDKRLRKCIVALEANGPIKMTVTADEGRNATTERLPGWKDNREHVINVPFGRDIMGRYFTFSFENIKGSDFSINNIETYIEVLLRKPKKEGVS